MGEGCWRYFAFCSDEEYNACRGSEGCEIYQEMRRQAEERKATRKRIRRENNLFMIVNCID